MQDTVTPPNEQPATAVPRREPPRAGDWLWRPWYAKLWWISIAIFWTIGLIWSLLNLPEPRELAFVDYLAFILHPQVAAPVLGFGFVWRWLEYQRSMGHEADVGGKPYGGYRGVGLHSPMSYLSDPGDIRSPLNPANPAHWSNHH